MKTSRFFAFILSLLAGLAAFPVRAFPDPPSATPVRQKLLMDFGWKFHLGDASSPDGDFGYGIGASFAKAGEATGPADPAFNDSLWRTLDLPHDWAVEQDFVNVKDEDVRDHGYKPIGRQFPKTTIGWYRKKFTLPKEQQGLHYELIFDGVFRDCDVWFNGHYVGRNLSGYSEFSIDLSDYMKFGAQNEITVRVDASQYEGWFYEGAGIYRHVWLLKTTPTHIALHGAYVTTSLSAGEAQLNFSTTVANDGVSSARCNVMTTVLNEDGLAVGVAASQWMRIPPNKRQTVTQNITIDKPLLWSPDAPHLYKLISVVHTDSGDIDRELINVGIRSVAFDKDSGLILNGARIEVKGVCCHQDHAGVGAALPDRLQYYRIEKLKEMGVNALRTSHNPPTPELLDACDKLGMMVMDENRLMGSSEEMKGQLRRLIMRDRDHPSVIIWSLGNEEWEIQNSNVGRNIAYTLKQVQQETDSSRLCTYAGNNGDHFEGINSVVDVRGINYINIGSNNNHGADSLSNSAPDRYHRAHPNQPVWGSEEASAWSTRGIYANDSVKGYMSDYDVNAPGYGATAETWWKFYAVRPWLAGAFVWTGFDYRGEPSPYSWPCINSHFGIMDVCGFPKNNYYYYQSRWTDKDVLHISPHWDWSGREGKPIDVWCQTNCDSVELFLNGSSEGMKRLEPNSHLQWSVLYAPGILEARGWRNGRLVTAKVETADSPSKLQLTPDRDSINADGEDICVVNLTAFDGRGREAFTADNLVKFEIEGGAKIIGVGNGNPSSHEPDKYLDGKYRRNLFNGKCQVIIQASRKPGPILLRAIPDGMDEAAVRIQAVAAEARPFIE